MRSGLGLGLAAPLALLLACGGVAFEVAPDDSGDGAASDGSPSDGAVNDGSSRDADATSGDVATDVAADTASDATADGGACPISATIQNGNACAPTGLRCPSAAPIYTCGGGMIAGYAMCTCTLGRWSCPPAGCVDAAPPPPTCPTPAAVRSGFPCATEGLQCAGNPQLCNGVMDYDAFQCTSSVWVPVSTTICGDAGRAGG
jgi:hypothetical protein